MKYFTLFILFVFGCTAILPLGPGLPIPPSRKPLQTVDAGQETAVSHGTGDELVNASPRYAPVYPLPPCCLSNRYSHPIMCRHCACTSTDLPTSAHGLTPCTTTLTTMPRRNLAPKVAAATTVTDTKYVDCHGCLLEIKIVDRFGHGPMYLQDS